jgi:hypothetical protein
LQKHHLHHRQRCATASTAAGGGGGGGDAADTKHGQPGPWSARYSGMCGHVWACMGACVRAVWVCGGRQGRRRKPHGHRVCPYSALAETSTQDRMSTGHGRALQSSASARVERRHCPMSIRRGGRSGKVSGEEARKKKKLGTINHACDFRFLPKQTSISSLSANRTASCSASCALRALLYTAIPTQASVERSQQQPGKI